MKRALVLGGGGVVGVAWETAIVATLLDEGIDLRDADLIVGTSAGSMVGTRLAAGFDPRVQPPRAEGGLPVPDGGPDLAALGRIFERWSQVEIPTPAFCQEIAAEALAARTAEEADWVAATGGLLEVDAWPDTPLRLSAIDVETGERVLWGAGSDASVDRAVASSCSVPGMFPPITIGSRRYIDGGLFSPTSADAALQVGPDLIVVIAPIGKGIGVAGTQADRSLEVERARCEAAGARVVVVQPEEMERQAFGPDLMAPAAAPAAADAGAERARMLMKGDLAQWADRR